MTVEKREIVISPHQQHERLDKFLTQTLGNLSRTRLQKLIEQGQVLVNGKPAKASHLIAPWEKIEVFIPPPQVPELIPEDIPLDIIYEDKYLLVVNKPAGMVVHPACGHYSGTLVNALLYHCHSLSRTTSPVRPGIVHRLDKDTSGLLVVAKTDEVHRQISEQFSARTIERQYVAIVWGHFKKKTDTLITHIGRSPTNRKKMAVVEDGKLAITTYEVIEELNMLSLIRLKLGTGRTHQIRVHMAAIGHPVFADYVYGGKSKKLSSLPAAQRSRAALYLEILNRQALHAKTLGFLHPVTKKWLQFDSEIPQDMQQLIYAAQR